MTASEQLPSRHFEPLRYGLGAWTEHIFFAYDLVAQLQPRLLVELGTDRGESYFALCQSARENETGTRSFAIDHWRGDPHAGSYDDATFADVEAHNRAHYAAFSTLVRSRFDDALEQFAPESIDLLHIDGHHTEEAARHDVESWLPKLRPGGILLMHDIAVRGRDFGVWKVWAEMTARGRSWAFPTPPGLGVWEKPPPKAVPAVLETLFAAPNECKEALQSYYRQRSANLQEEVAQQWRDGTIRSAPMAAETGIQVFWTSDGHYTEENSTDVRVGHEAWKEVAVALPTKSRVTGLRIDFFSALTIVEIARIILETGAGNELWRATRGEEFDSVALRGDCLRLGSDLLTIQVTGVDPQLHLPPLPEFASAQGIIVRMRLRVKNNQPKRLRDSREMQF